MLSFDIHAKDFAIDKYISTNTRNGIWGEGTIDATSKRLDRELPGLRGFSERNLRYMRTFYEEWNYLEKLPNINLEPAGAKIQNETIKSINFPIVEFLSLGFTLHRTILSKVKTPH